MNSTVAKPQLELKWTLQTPYLQLDSWIWLEKKKQKQTKAHQTSLGKRKQIYGRKKKQSIETNPEMARISHLAEIHKYVQRLEGKYAINKWTGWESQKKKMEIIKKYQMEIMNLKV